jgi:hypothetical protein
MYDIFTNLGHFLPILEPWDSILGYLINLGVWKCYIRAQRRSKKMIMTKNEHPSPDSSINTDAWHFHQFWPFFTNFGALWNIDPILGNLVTLGVWKCYIWARQGRKWGRRTKNEHSSPNSSVDTDVWHFYQFGPFLTNFGAMGLNFGIPNQFRCLKVLY